MGVISIMHGEHALIDGDLWTYDIAYAAQSKNPDGTLDIKPFEHCQKLIHRRLNEILTMSQCKTFEGYLTGKGNFRNDIAVTVPYKGTRKREKPFHYNNIRVYLEGHLGFKTVHGMEADDILALRQYQLGEKSCIISRDKDLRMVPGWHFGYSCGKQKSFGPQLYDEMGQLTLLGRGSKQKIQGGGLMFFYSQLITGDRTDNILGIPKAGDVRAYEELNECQTEEEMFQKVLNMYVRTFGEELGYKRMLESGRLLWMTKELHEDGSPVLWEFPFKPVLTEETLQSLDAAKEESSSRTEDASSSTNAKDRNDDVLCSTDGAKDAAEGGVGDVHQCS